MKLLKPAFEAIKPTFGSSFSYTRFTQNKNNNASYWHYHPEIELVYVDGGSGRRQIGSHISYFTNGDLILVGSNLPHCGFTDPSTGNKSEFVIHLAPDFLGEAIFSKPEMANIRQLFDKCRGGMSFSGKTKEAIGARIEALEGQTQFERLLNILSILNDLELSDEYQLLNAAGFSLEAEVQDNDRINMVFNYVKLNYRRHITLEEISDYVSMAVPSFCRYFKKISGKTFTHFVNEYRVVHACKLLAEKPISITEICFESGFNNFSYFNKTFKEYTGKAPSHYRNELKKILTEG